MFSKPYMFVNCDKSALYHKHSERHLCLKTFVFFACLFFISDCNKFRMTSFTLLQENEERGRERE